MDNKPSPEKPESSDEDENEPYNRWQGFRIGQLGLCIALFLTFSVALPGFSVNLLVQHANDLTSCSAKALFLLSLLFGVCSVVTGCVACLTRLADFRATARVARNREDSTKIAQVEQWRKDYRRYGAWTWNLFRCQLVAFGLQGLLLMFTLAIAYLPRLQ